MNAKNFTVEYTHPKTGIYYLADFIHTKTSDFTSDKAKAMPMTRQTAAKAVARSVNPAKIVSLS